jgi:hypothetical protein
MDVVLSQKLVSNELYTLLIRAYPKDTRQIFL